MNKNKWYMSSSNSKELARTVKGFFAVGVISAIVIFLSIIGYDITELEIQGIVDALANLIASIGILGGSIYGLYGAIMKVVNKIKNK